MIKCEVRKEKDFYKVVLIGYRGKEIMSSKYYKKKAYALKIFRILEEIINTFKNYQNE